MTSSSIFWLPVDRGNVAKALLGTQTTPFDFNESKNLLSRPDVAGDINIGFVNGGTRSAAAAVAIVDKRQAEDLFAWLATYSPEVFPLSQYVRVLDTEEWKRAEDIPACSRLDADPIWPSLILGELLAQGNNSELRLTSVPLSRVPFCLSYTQARASTLFRSSPDALRIAADRIEMLESAERRWRLVGTDVLRSTWALAEDAFDLDAFTRELVNVLSWSFERQRDGRSPQPPMPEELRKISLDLRKLAAGPLEYRVEEFERASSLLLACADTFNTGFYARLPALLAALALWVGSGTSHISLLAEIALKFPATYAWFGAFAGVLGPNCWHSEWARTSSAIAKQLRSGFDVASTSTADLSWTEFAWLLSVGHFELLSGVPRASAKIVSVDVLPGASASFRLSADDGQVVTNTDITKTEPLGARQPKSSAPNTVAFSDHEASISSASAASQVTWSTEQVNAIASAVKTLSALLDNVRSTQPVSPDEQFELKPPPASAKKTPSGRKTPRKSATRK
ncbi:hypothetical protein [Burkholderia pseudomallei]|uniref:hypothetical protein n=1 Tax=Burkholderia pseudomallei TaxID=28450 RepID=UPI00168A3FE4|nr:hypothetical protein [Burkholderia pseudomallei]MBD2956676.1 hypothetical protein [Burkholderia pseudomallei]MBD2974901.1 hypothetical protein [Burkholderia pseudomallei]MBF3693472.1 hypothetical protein [Burkholderia pseudomallei]